MITTHVAERIALRVSSRADAREIERSVESAQAALRQHGIRDAAVRVWREATRVNAQDGSNGEALVLIVRNGQAVTAMWRRVTQAHTAEAHRVARVLCVSGTCSPAEHRAHK